MNPQANQKGQVFVEWMIFFSTTAFTVLWIGNFIWQHWRQFHCTYEVFQTAHQSLIHSKRYPSKVSIQIYETPYFVEATAQCPFGTETVQLPHLQEAIW